LARAGNRASSLTEKRLPAIRGSRQGRGIDGGAPSLPVISGLLPSLSRGVRFMSSLGLPVSSSSTCPLGLPVFVPLVIPGLVRGSPPARNTGRQARGFMPMRTRLSSREQDPRRRIMQPDQSYSAVWVWRQTSRPYRPHHSRRATRIVTWPCRRRARGKAAGAAHPATPDGRSASPGPPRAPRAAPAGGRRQSAH
jgi:hypothetical protein